MSSPQSKKPANWYDALDEEQVGAFNFIMHRLKLSGGVALFAEQGTGKTIITLAVMQALKVQRVLIVTPLTSIEPTWLVRLRETFPVHVMFQNAQKRAVGDLAHFVVINYEKLAKMKLAAIRHVLDRYDLVVFDEAQALKARASGWSRAARKLRNAKRRLILSGTPIDESPIDVWGQMRFVDHTVLGEDWKPFAEEYCIKGGFMNKKYIFRKAKMKQFLKTLEPYVYRLTKEYLGLKPIKVHPIPVKLLGRQRRIYDKMERSNVVRVGDHIISAEMAAVVGVKCEQITGGYVKDEEGEWVHVGNAKIRKLKALIKKLKTPIGIYVKFLGEMDAILDVLPGKARPLYGKVKGEQRTARIRLFQKGKIDYLVCQRKTGGVSIEFSHAQNLIMYSTGYSYIDFEQIMSRFHRRGQKGEVNVFLLYAVDTVDEDIVEVISEKRSTVFKVMQHFERRA